MCAELISVSGLCVNFSQSGKLFGRKTLVRAVQDVSLTIRKGEVLGLVGESGSGKTTLGRAIMRLVEPSSGEIKFDGENITSKYGNELISFRRRAQIVFQDPFSSLNPKMQLKDIIAEPMRVHQALPKRVQFERIGELLQMVGLKPDNMARYPHQFSGGQRQRIAIARALALNPDFILADEAVSALDVSVQAQIINLFNEIKKNLDLTMLFIGHDLAVVRYISDRVAVMYLGKIVEIAPANHFVTKSAHPYTKALIEAIPEADPFSAQAAEPIRGEIPSLTTVEVGCSFRSRCRFALQQCADVVPSLRPIGEDHLVACIRDDVVNASAAS